jgi:hypothetical protein
MKIRVAQSLGGGFDGTFAEAWGLEEYRSTFDFKEPTVFVGCYGLPDFYAIWRHKGDKYIFWCGSDIRHLHNGYWLDGKGQIRLSSKGIAKWINDNCESWVENEPERKALEYWGIKAQVCPSYIGDIDKIEPSYKPGNKLYASVSSDDFAFYGWHKIDNLAEKYPDIEFHLYGNTKPFKPDNKNVIVHGRVPNEQMIEETKDMQGCIRMLPMEGFSELVARSVLMEQWPISVIPYKHCLLVEQIGEIPKEPNVEGRRYYLKELNNFPFNCNKNVV